MSTTSSKSSPLGATAEVTVTIVTVTSAVLGGGEGV